MNISFYIDKILSLCFPPQKQSRYFLHWSPADYRTQIQSALSINTSIHALFQYKDPIARMLIRSIKKEKILSIRDALASLMAEEIMGMYAETYAFNNNPVYIVPIPLSHRRLQERGFNQSGFLAQKVAHILGPSFVYSPYLLHKIKETKKQALLHRRDRLTNPIGSFKASNVPIGAHIILIDDVVTTGATTGEARKMLLQAGAHEVTVYCVAH
jgi:ComF family protein